MNPKSQSAAVENQMFDLLSQTSRAAFELAEAARQQLDDPELEIAHLLYGLYSKHGTAARKVLTAAGISEENVLGVLGLSLTNGSEVGRGISLSSLPPLAPHTSAALDTANRLRVGRGAERIRARHLFAGVIQCDECSLVRKLKMKNGLTFDLDAYEQAEGAAPSHKESSVTPLRSEENDEAPVSETQSDPVLVGKVGKTSIFVQETQAPWKLPVDAFTLFTDSQVHPQGIYGDLLQRYLGADDWAILMKAIEASRSELSSYAIDPVLLVPVPDALRERGLAKMILVTEANSSAQSTWGPNWKATEVLGRAAQARISRVTLPLTSRDGYNPSDDVTIKAGADEANATTTAVLSASRDNPKLRELAAITLTTPFSVIAQSAIENARSTLDRDVWKEMSATVHRAFRWAAAAAGQKDGHQSRITPLHLLAGLLFGPVDPSQPLSRAFLEQAIEAALPTTGDSQDHPLNRIASLIEVPLTATPFELDALPPLAPDTRSALHEALELRPAGREGIHARDIVAGLLLTTQADRIAPAAKALSDRGFELSGFPDRFIEYIKDGTPMELEHWRAVLNRASSRELSLPVRAKIDNDDVRGAIKPEDDKLKIAKEVDRFARLLVARDVKPPISVGLFGNWGTGKTFFMGLLKSRIDELASDQKTTDTYVANVAQIDFNAWHYVDTNLWASMAMRIFDGLTDTLGFEQGSDIEETRRKLHSSIESSKKTRERAEQQQEAATKQRAEAQSSLAERRAKRDALATQQRNTRLQRVWEEALNDPVFENEKEELANIAEQFGLPRALTSIDEAQRLFEQLGSINGRVGGLAAAVSARFRDGSTAAKTITAVVFVVVAALLLGFATNALRASSQWLKDAIPEASAVVVQLAALVSTAAAWASRRAASVSEGLRKFEALQAKFQDKEAKSPVPEAEQKLQKEIETLDAEIQKSTETISEADRRIAEAEAELQRINQGGLVYDFLKDRRQNARYQDQLGLVSTIRGDFERLRKLLDDLTTHGKPIERIILYIDDLDRCHPKQVVEVLQAVHLLLAFDLFSVVVGVDARWLERSLCRAYVGRGTWSSATPGSRQGSSAFSAQNYLEKIFQIPYSLQGMSKGGFQELVGHLVTTRSEQEKAAHVQAPGASGQQEAQQSREVRRKDEEQQPNLKAKGSKTVNTSDSAKGEGRSISDETVNPPPTSDPPAVVDTKQAIEALFLYDWEETYMQGLHAFIPTPRLAKRFVNVYRLLRVRATEKDFERFIGDKFDGEYRTVLLLLAINIGFPSVGAILLRVLARQRPAGTWSHFIEELDPDTPDENREEWAKAISWSPEHKAEFARLKRAISTLVPHPSFPESLEPYVDWAEEVGRYSFHWNIADWDEQVSESNSEPTGNAHQRRPPQPQ
jgi:hypothetical protein